MLTTGVTAMSTFVGSDPHPKCAVCRRDCDVIRARLNGIVWGEFYFCRWDKRLFDNRPEWVGRIMYHVTWTATMVTKLRWHLLYSKDCDLCAEWRRSIHGPVPVDGRTTIG